jgi:hypothetical protein
MVLLSLTAFEIDIYSYQWTSITVLNEIYYSTKSSPGKVKWDEEKQKKILWISISLYGIDVCFFKEINKL